MANLRQNKIGTATFLAIVVLGLGAWLVGRGSDDSVPTGPSQRQLQTERKDTGPAIESTTSSVKADARQSTEREQVPEYTSDTSTIPATIEIHVHFAGPDEERSVQFRAVGEKSQLVVGRSECRSTGNEAIGYLEVSPNQWNHIEAVVEGAQVPGRRLHLGPGERYRIDLQCGVNRTRLRVIGPSSELAPHLRLEVVDQGHDPAVPFHLPLDAEGSVECHFTGTARAGVVLTGSRRTSHPVPLHTHTGARVFDTSLDRVDVLPAQSLLGITALHRRRPIPAAIRLGASPAYHAPVLCTITTLGLAGTVESIHVRTEMFGDQRGPLDRVAQNGDMWTVDTAVLVHLGVLRVTYGDDSEDAKISALVAVPPTGGEPVRLAETKDRLARQALLPAGNYRLAWAPHGVPEETAVEVVRVKANDVTRLKLSPRLLETWTVHLRDAPRDTRLVLGWDQLFFGTSDKGSFEVAIGYAPVVGQRARLVSLQQKTSYAATFVRVDANSRAAEVTSNISDASLSRLTPVPLQNGRIRIHLLPSAANPDIGGMTRSHNLLLLPGTKRHGYVIEVIDGQEQVTRWFEIMSGTPELTLTPTGRWVTMRFGAPTARARVTCDGPAGESAVLRFKAMEGSIQLYVAEGTTAVHVEVDSGRHSFDPRLTEFVVR